MKTEADLAVLPYLSPEYHARDSEQMVRQRQELRILADEFAVPLVGYRAGMDWLIWLFPPEEIILRSLDEQAFVQALLVQINRAYTSRLVQLLELAGRSLPARLVRIHRFLEPAAVPRIRTSHAGGGDTTLLCRRRPVYLPDGQRGDAAAELAALDFDCLFGVDPATRPIALEQVRAALPGKALWGGISGPLQLGAGTPAQVERAVEQAFAACSRRGFVLGPAVGIRAVWPWENIEALDPAWRRLRAGKTRDMRKLRCTCIPVCRNTGLYSSLAALFNVSLCLVIWHSCHRACILLHSLYYKWEGIHQTNNQIEKLTIKGFKSIRNLNDFHLNRLNVLIGANGAEK